jgi:hypothetical protein
MKGHIHLIYSLHNLAMKTDNYYFANYRIFKNKIEFENYLNILDDRDIFPFCRFRLNNHKLPVEYGRWKNIPRELKICNTADLG